MLPHHQNTGGFFIALLEKKEWLPWQKQRKLSKASSEPSGDKNTLFELPIPSTLSEESDTTPVSQDTVTASQDTKSDTNEELSKPFQDIASTTDMAQDTTDKAQDTTVKVQDTADKAQDTTDKAQDTATTEGVKTPKENEERPSRAVLGRSVSACHNPLK